MAKIKHSDIGKSYSIMKKMIVICKGVVMMV